MFLCTTIDTVAWHEEQQPIQCSMPPAGSIWSATATLAYVRDLERYANDLERRLRTPQQLKLEEAK